MTADRSTLGALALNNLVQLSKCALSDDNCAGWDVANLRIRGLSAEALADLRAVLDRNRELEANNAELQRLDNESTRAIAALKAKVESGRIQSADDATAGQDRFHECTAPNAQKEDK